MTIEQLMGELRVLSLWHNATATYAADAWERIRNAEESIQRRLPAQCYLRYVVEESSYGLFVAAKDEE